MSSQAFPNLDDRTVLRILSEATAELREQLPEDQRHQLRGPVEASRSLAQLLQEHEVAPGPLGLDRFADPAIARRLLSTMLDDPGTRPIVEPLVANPPQDQQKSVELAAAGAVILGSVIAWLQTTIDISVNRAGGKTEFSFKLRKAAAGEGVVKEVAKRVGGLLSGGL